MPAKYHTIPLIAHTLYPLSIPSVLLALVRLTVTFPSLRLSAFSLCIQLWTLYHFFPYVPSNILKTTPILFYIIGPPFPVA
jgi:hypothetical protein